MAYAVLRSAKPARIKISAPAASVGRCQCRLVHPHPSIAPSSDRQVLSRGLDLGTDRLYTNLRLGLFIIHMFECVVYLEITAARLCEYLNAIESELV